MLNTHIQEVLSNIRDIGYDRIPAIDSLSITINGVAKQLSLLKTDKASRQTSVILDTTEYQLSTVCLSPLMELQSSYPCWRQIKPLDPMPFHRDF